MASRAPPSHTSASANPNPHQRRPKKVLLPGSSTEVFMTEDEALPYFKNLQPSCARCGSPSTHFRYFNNKWKSTDKIQPRYACKGCRRAFTLDGKLRDVPPVGDQQPMEPKKKKAKISKGTPSQADLVMMPAIITNAHNAALPQRHALGLINVQLHHPPMAQQHYYLPPPYSQHLIPSPLQEYLAGCSNTGMINVQLQHPPMAQQYYYLPPPYSQHLIPSPPQEHLAGCSNTGMPHEFYPGYSDDQLVHTQLQLLCASSSTSTSASYNSSPGTASTSISPFAGMQQDSNDQLFTVEDLLQTDTHLDDGGNSQVAEHTRASVDFTSSVPTPDDTLNGTGHLILSDSENEAFLQLLEILSSSLGMQDLP